MDNTKKSSGSSRVGILDELRGFAIICMVVYHAMYDLKYLFGLDIPIFFDGWFDVIRDIFAGLFIFISGTVCRYSSNNIKRGAQCFFHGMIRPSSCRSSQSGTVMFGIRISSASAWMLFGARTEAFRPAPLLGWHRRMRSAVHSHDERPADLRKRHDLPGLHRYPESVRHKAPNGGLQCRRAGSRWDFTTRRSVPRITSR